MQRLLTYAPLGTSLSASLSGWNWQQFVRDRLAPGAKRAIRPMVFAIQGEDSSGGLVQAARAAPMRPDAVTIEFSINDAIPQRNISQAQSKANLNTMIDTILAANSAASIFVMTMNPVVLSINPNLPNYEAYVQGYRDVAADRGLPLIDNYASWGTATADEIPDGTHPLLAGLQRVTIPNVVAALRPLVT